MMSCGCLENSGRADALLMATHCVDVLFSGGSRKMVRVTYATGLSQMVSKEFYNHTVHKTSDF